MNRTVLICIKLYFSTTELLYLHHTMLHLQYEGQSTGILLQVCIDMADICCIFHTYSVWFTFQVTMCVCINNLCCENILPNCIGGIVGRVILLVSVGRQNFHFFLIFFTKIIFTQCQR
jgi:hypothetical protein